MTIDTNAQDTATQPIIALEGLTFARGEHLIFDQIDLVIPKGKVTAVMGPSGTGKTTLLRLIGGQLKPQSGDVLVAGERVNRLKRKALYQLRRRMGVLFQNGALFTDLTVGENVAFPLREHTQLSEQLIEYIVLFKLEAVGLRAAKDRYPASLSGGMARRAALARAIALDPEILLYDEPFTGQDPISMGVLLRLIKELNQALGLSSMVITHDVDEAFSICDHLVVLAEGKVLASGSPEQLQAQKKQDPALAQFLDGLATGPLSNEEQADSMAAALGFSEALR